MKSRNKKSVSEWKIENGLKSINFCIPITLLQELDYWKKHFGMSRSEIIRSGIRMYINHQKDNMVKSERHKLDMYYLKNKNKKLEVNTGLLPDY